MRGPAPGGVRWCAPGQPSKQVVEKRPLAASQSVGAPSVGGQSHFRCDGLRKNRDRSGAKTGTVPRLVRDVHRRLDAGRSFVATTPPGAST